MSLIDQLKENRQRLLAEAEAIITKARMSGRSLTAVEARRFDDLELEIREIDERLSEVEEEAMRESRAAAIRRTYGLTDVDDPHAVYRRGSGPSFFRDMVRARAGDRDAIERLAANEARAGSTAPGAGGEFAPPLWLIDQYVNMARPARPLADRVTRRELPPGISSINIPKVNVGTLVGGQSENASLPDRDIATSAISAPIVTVGGKTVVSQQLLDQAGVSLDEVLGDDLTRALSAEIERQLLVGGGPSAHELAGLMGVAGTHSVSFTSSAPAVASANPSDSLLAAITQASAEIQTSIFAPPDTIVMHPRRWAWILSSVDTTDRPLITPSASFNAVGDVTATAAQGVVGRIAGLDVIVDPQIPVDLGTGQNQDAVLVLRAPEIVLFESGPRLQSFDQPYADSLGVLFRIYSYAALVVRRPEAVAVISGTGLVAPTL
ncbi:MAG: phage major capsid protein [Acidothermus cellulolyticus]|nr:phage major capsid protein [Acidothermus sp.]MCL6550892.1 phage major capsid protein [Acidothermus cellulolyticus]